MLQAKSILLKIDPIRRLAVSLSLLMLLSLGLPMVVRADPPDDTSRETCGRCHEEETETWENSSHAGAAGSTPEQSGATCQACHGSYTENHPEMSFMRLTVDSTVCETCHTGTFTQWADSRHAQAGVECTGCHLSHSQQFRLTDETLCSSCHRDQVEDVFHIAHVSSEVNCIACHLNSISPSGPGQPNEAGGPAVVPSHDFAAVVAESCVTCHKQDVYADPAIYTRVDWVAQARLLEEAERVPKLASELETAQQTARSLRTIVPVSLGLGLGVGGMLGIILMLGLNHLGRRR